MEKIKLLYDRLVESARKSQTISYFEVGAILGLNSTDPAGRAEIGHVLTEIACRENAEGRPLLSAVVVLPEIGYPGKGFFLLAHELGVNNSYDDRSFYYYELRRVYEYWSNKAPGFIPSPPSHLGYNSNVPADIH
jgi:hypothetical protein